jgi:hypothetical protein
MSHYNRDTAKGRILSDLDGSILTDCDHATRSLFRCWVDGSYLGEDHGLRNKAFIAAHRDNPKAMRSFVIAEFTKYTAHDAQCSPSYAQRVIVNGLTYDALDSLTDALVNDVLEMPV